MAGSKKGERRGAAARQRNAEAAATFEAAGVVQPQKPRGNGGKGPATSTEQYYRDVVRFVNGTTAEELEPREVMLKAMRWFNERAEEYVKMSHWLLGKLTELKTAEEFAAHDLQLQTVELKIREFYMLAVDVAFKCAPYVHPRLSAVAVADSSRNPINVIGVLLQEIDAANRGRPTWAPPEQTEIETDYIAETHALPAELAGTD